MRTRQSRDRLLKAALKIFARKGYASSSVSDIIKDAGVARGTFYLYFGSKRNAFEQVLTSIIDEIEKLAPGPQEKNHFPSPEHLYQRIYTSVEAFIKLLYRNRAFARIVFTEATGLDKGFDRQLEDHYSNHRRNIRKFLNGVRRSGFARSFDVDITCEAIIGYVERCARTFISDNGNRVKLKKLVKELADFEFAALCRSNHG